LQIWPCTPTTPHLGEFFIREMGHVNIYPCTKLEVSSFTRSQFKEDPNIYKFGPWTPPRPLLGYFLIHKMGLAKVYPYTKFEVSNFTCSKFTEGLKILKIRPLGPWARPIWGMWSFMSWDLPRSVRTPHNKFELSNFIRSKFREWGFKIRKFGPWAPNHATSGVFCHSWDWTCQTIHVPNTSPVPKIRGRCMHCLVARVVCRN